MSVEPEWLRYKQGYLQGILDILDLDVEEKPQ
jgi:hypothetical protein